MYLSWIIGFDGFHRDVATTGLKQHSVISWLALVTCYCLLWSPVIAYSLLYHHVAMLYNVFGYVIDVLMMTLRGQYEA